MDINKRVYTILVLLTALWCIGILLAPALQVDHPVASSIVYSAYSPICHQIDGRCFHLFGAKWGLCIRCSAIYFSFFLSLLLYPLFRRLSSHSFPGRWWIALAVGPMILDVLLNFTGIYQSTPLTRTITGMFFGSVLPFYILPPLLEGVAQLRSQFSARGGLFYARKAQ
ncbi:MAG: DUF2085 domain-containing protein [Ignavibacteriales bacterium]|nr:DUF2085 domain-containing protein [Ignavibacteriales bacterium]